MNKSLFAAVFGVVLLLLVENCSSNKGRIVGGHDVPIYYRPYQVSLRRRMTEVSSYFHFCGGSLLDSGTILTAAHCVVNKKPEEFIVVAGTDRQSGSGVVARVVKLMPHEWYDESTTDNDIALLLVNPHFPVSPKISPISLAQQLPPEGSAVTVSGWGYTSEHGAGADKLQEVELAIIDRESCQSANYWRPVTYKMVCASVPAGGKDACQGDSGGPLVFKNQQVGIVSWGLGCGRRGYPGVYASVPYFQKWIAMHRAYSYAYRGKINH